MKFLACLVLPVLGGCSIGNVSEALYPTRTSDWYETGNIVITRTEILSTVRQAIIRQGYTIELSDEAAGTFQTAWDVQLSSRFREGTRTMIETEVAALDGGGFNVRVRSTLEINNQDKNPSMPEKAVWIGAGHSDKHKDRVADPALKLQSLLKVRFFGLGS